MKGMDIFCSTPASTAICSSMEQRSMVRHGTASIDRHINSRLQDRRRSGRLPVPCSSQLPINPKPYNQKSRKSCVAKETDVITRKSSADISENLTSPPGSSRYLLSDDAPFFDFLSDSSDHISALVPTTQPATVPPQLISSNDHSPRALKYSSLRARQLISSNDTPLFKSSSSRARQLITSNDSPLFKSSSTRARQLITSNDSPLFESSSTRARQLITSNDSPLFKSSSTRARQLSSNDSSLLKSSSSRARQLSSNDSPALKSSSSARSRDQVVVLRVSLHCKGCEGKVRKHISRMEGVTSFSIDLATKKVTIIGDITPLSVLESVSRVKNAQLWPSPASSSSSPSSSSMVDLSTY